MIKNFNEYLGFFTLLAFTAAPAWAVSPRVERALVDLRSAENQLDRNQTRYSEEEVFRRLIKNPELSTPLLYPNAGFFDELADAITDQVQALKSENGKSRLEKMSLLRDTLLLADLVYVHQRRHIAELLAPYPTSRQEIRGVLHLLIVLAMVVSTNGIDWPPFIDTPALKASTIAVTFIFGYEGYKASLNLLRLRIARSLEEAGGKYYFGNNSPLEAFWDRVRANLKRHSIPGDLMGKLSRGRLHRNPERVCEALLTSGDIRLAAL